MAELPTGVEVVAAAKGKPPAQILEALKAGIRIIGENYVNEAKKAYDVVGKEAIWHFIGTLQKHNVRKSALAIFDMIESVHSLEIAAEIDRKCAQAGRAMPVLIEVNSAREQQKSGVLPEEVEHLMRLVSGLKSIRVMGLMTMGPRSATAEECAPCFKETRKVFERLDRLALPNVEMRYLSMGMSDSYKVALDEGANMIRLGTAIFGAPDQI